MIKKKWLALLLAMMMVLGLFGGVVAANGSDECERYGQGYWKQWLADKAEEEPEWECESGFTAAELLGVLNTPARGNATQILLYQFIAAQLNVNINGCKPPSAVVAALGDAGAHLDAGDESEATRQQILDWKDILEFWNQNEYAELLSVEYHGICNLFGSHVGDYMVFTFSNDVSKDGDVHIQSPKNLNLRDFGWDFLEVMEFDIDGGNVVTVDAIDEFRRPRDTDDSVTVISGLVDFIGNPVIVPASGVPIDIYSIECLAYFEPSIDAPATVIAGENAWVTWTVENTGDVAGTQDIRRGVWRPDGGMHSVVTEEDVYLEPGETWTHTARYVLTAAGTYPLELRTDDETVTTEIVVGPGDPANAEFIYQPADGIVGQALTSDDNGYPAILVTDEYGNPVPGEEVELGLTNIGWNFRRVGTGTDPQVTDADGIATYNDLVFDAPGSYRFTSRVLGTDPLVRASSVWFEIRCSEECVGGVVDIDHSSADQDPIGNYENEMTATVLDCCGQPIEGLTMDNIYFHHGHTGRTLTGYQYDDQCWVVSDFSYDGDGVYSWIMYRDCTDRPKTWDNWSLSVWCSGDWVEIHDADLFQILE